MKGTFDEVPTRPCAIEEKSSVVKERAKVSKLQVSKR